MRSDRSCPDGMIVELNVPVPMRDGSTLFANLYRPVGTGRHPVIVSTTPYGKDVHVSAAFPAVWEAVAARYPSILAASSCDHMIWEAPDPETWTARGYAMLQVDARGTGKSPGFREPNCPQEAEDGCDAIAWAVAQDWCTGKAGMLGLGYVTCTNWRVAALRPAGLAAAVFYQGTWDFYGDRVTSDGIFQNGFTSVWWQEHGLWHQHGNGASPFRDMYTGEISPGPGILTPEALAANRVDYPELLLEHPLKDDWFRERTADLAAIEIPALVMANWGGLGLQLRGTIRGWEGLASREKWLKIEGGSYFFTFFTPERVAFLARFFDRYLQGEETGWADQPRVEVDVRTPEDTLAETLADDDWPLPGIEWRRHYLDLDARSLVDAPPAAGTRAGYTPGESRVTLSTAPFPETTTIAGPLAARLWLSCETEDTDLFLTVRLIAPDGTDASFFGATDPALPPSNGWLRASQRRLDPIRSSEYRPVHAHDRREPLVPGQIHEVEISVWPTALRIPAGHRLALVVGGSDFVWPPEAGKEAWKVPMIHDEPRDRPPAIFTGRVTLHAGGPYPAFLAVPVLPAPS